MFQENINMLKLSCLRIETINKLRVSSIFTGLIRKLFKGVRINGYYFQELLSRSVLPPKSESDSAPNRCHYHWSETSPRKVKWPDKKTVSVLWETLVNVQMER